MLNNAFIELLILIVIIILLIKLTKKIINKYISKYHINSNRGEFLQRIAITTVCFIGVPFLMGILGVEPNQLVVLGSSVFAIVGVGFVAQWSILSNITAGILLFFNHPIRIGDTIRILDKDLDVKGRINNITGFYTHIHIEEENRDIIVPNTIILFKGVEIIKTNP